MFLELCIYEWVVIVYILCIYYIILWRVRDRYNEIENESFICLNFYLVVFKYNYLFLN